MEYIKTIKKLIADKTGHEIAEITDESYFEDDLNVGNMELVDILEELEEKLQIELMDQKDTIETVGDLVDAVAEQVE